MGEDHRGAGGGQVADPGPGTWLVVGRWLTWALDPAGSGQEVQAWGQCPPLLPSWLECISHCAAGFGSCGRQASTVRVSCASWSLCLVQALPRSWHDQFWSSLPSCGAKAMLTILGPPEEV